MIVIDVFEPNKIAADIGGAGRVKALKIGDYLFASRSGLVGIERKAIGDLLGSMADASLMKQLRELSSTVDVPMLLVEGWMTVNSDGRLRYNGGVMDYPWTYVSNFLLSVQLSGIPVMRSPNRSQTARMVISLEKYFNKKQHSALMKVPGPKLTISAREATRLQILMGLPGVGEKLARRLLKKFGAPANVLIASQDVLREVDGIGTAKARKIVRAARG